MKKYITEWSHLINTKFEFTPTGATLPPINTKVGFTLAGATHVDMPPINTRVGFTLAGATHVDMPPNLAKETSILEGQGTHVDMPPINAKVGFTLAEILITLGIIGVVAAMTIPSLYNTMQKKVTIARLQKTYSEIANASKLAIDTSGGLLLVGEGTSRERFEKYLMPHLKGTPKGVERNSLIYYTTAGTRETGLNLMRSNSTEFILPSGVSLLVDDNENPYTAHAWIKSLQIMIDTNGYKNPPNKFGHDAFIMTLYSNDATALTMADDGEGGTVNRNREELKNGPSKYNYQCNRKGRGMWCGALIQKDGWKISPDYPW